MFRIASGVYSEKARAPYYYDAFTYQNAMFCMGLMGTAIPGPVFRAWNDMPRRIIALLLQQECRTAFIRIWCMAADILPL